MCLPGKISEDWSGGCNQNGKNPFLTVYVLVSDEVIIARFTRNVDTPTFKLLPADDSWSLDWNCWIIRP